MCADTEFIPLHHSYVLQTVVSQSFFSPFVPPWNARKERIPTLLPPTLLLILHATESRKIKCLVPVNWEIVDGTCHYMPNTMLLGLPQVNIANSVFGVNLFGTHFRLLFIF